MDFTPEQLAFISKLVEAKVLSIKSQQRKTQREYHSLPELRVIILNNESSLRLDLDYEPFRMEAFIHCLRKFIELRPLDSQLMDDGSLRLDAQIGTAISKWETCPFTRSADHPRHLYWKQS